MTERKPISKKIRFEVFKRDSFTCQYCGKSAPDVILHIDHIMPVSKGGDNDITNLITACNLCNQGKSDNLLDDDAVITKRKKQLDDLQKRREQIEMMYKWHSELLDIDNDSVEMVCKLFNDLVPNYSINENGKPDIKRMINRYTLSEVVESLKISANQYLEFIDGMATQESAYKTYNYIERICRNRKRFSKKPYLQDLYYIRGILKHRFSYVNEWESIKILEDGYKAGIEFEDLKIIALESTCYSNWKQNMLFEIDNQEDKNVEAQR